jgi:hypothetical protein
MICPADRAEMNHESKTCPLSLYLQAKDAHRVCESRLHTVPPEPLLLRHGAGVVFTHQYRAQSFSDVNWEIGNPQPIPFVVQG